jgi:hypothetical protein
MAKGSRLIAAGGDPKAFGGTPSRFLSLRGERGLWPLRRNTDLGLSLTRMSVRF